MSVKLNPLGLKFLLEDQAGPVARDLARRADNVLQKANENVSNLILQVRTADLRGNLRAFIERDAEGLYAAIGTDARHRNFAYPTFLDGGVEGVGGTGTHPWLTPALRDGFDE